MSRETFSLAISFGCEELISRCCRVSRPRVQLRLLLLQNDAQDAISRFDGSSFEGAILKVTRGKNKDELAEERAGSGESALARRTVLLKGLPKAETSEDAVRRMLSTIAPSCAGAEALRAVVAPVPNPGSYSVSDPSIGVAKVVFADTARAREAIASVNGKKFEGHFLAALPLEKVQKLKKWRLIVRNVAFQCREDLLAKKLRPFGAIWDVTIPRMPHDPKKIRGFGFVQFVDQPSAARAVKEGNGKKIAGRPIAVDWSLSKGEYDTQVAGSTAGTNDAEDRDRPEQKAGDDSDTSDDDDAGMGGRKISQSSDAKGKVQGDSVDVVEAEIDTSTGTATEKADSADEGSARGMSDVEDDSIFDDNALELDGDKAEEGKDASRSAPIPQDDADEVERTVFVRNIPFEATRGQVMKALGTFGAIASCYIVFDKKTGRPRGSAFVHFSDAKSAHAAVCASTEGMADGGQNLVGGGRGTALLSSTLAEKTVSGDNDAGSLAGNAPSLGGRKLLITSAVSRRQAQSFAGSTTSAKKKSDKRNLYLADEGRIVPESPEAEGLTEPELRKRAAMEREKREKLKSPNFFVSKVRLSVKNIPPHITEGDIRKRMNAAAEGAGKVQAVRLIRDGESHGRAKGHKGFGFVEFSTHEGALRALRALNNNESVYGKGRRPIISFSIENIHAAKKQAERAKERSTDSVSMYRAGGKRLGKRERKRASRSGDGDEGAGDGDAADAAEGSGSEPQTRPHQPRPAKRPPKNKSNDASSAAGARKGQKRRHDNVPAAAKRARPHVQSHRDAEASVMDKLAQSGEAGNARSRGPSRRQRKQHKSDVTELKNTYKQYLSNTDLSGDWFA